MAWNMPLLSMLIFPSYWYVKLAKVPYPLIAWACSDTTSWTSQSLRPPTTETMIGAPSPTIWSQSFFFVALILRQPGRLHQVCQMIQDLFDPFRESSGVLAGSWVSSVTSAFILAHAACRASSRLTGLAWHFCGLTVLNPPEPRDFARCQV